MTPSLLGRGAKDASAEQVSERAAALGAALDSGGAQLDPTLVARAEGVLERVSARMARGGAQTVVALAGATGSGKSSLFNALVGTDVATIGARRPTTSTPTAAIWGEGPGAGELLDWLEVGARHRVDTPPDGPLTGLVLLDLPDFDSREVSHRIEAERILERCDVFVWVTDPQKYADARLHDDYVAAMMHHDAVTVVVLNQADRLTPAQLQECVADLRRLLARDGLPKAPVLATSVRTGDGLDSLRDQLAKAVSGARAARLRLNADVVAVAEALRATEIADTEPDVSGAARRELVAALGRAAGVPAVLDAVRRDYARDAVAATGWPFTRWVARLRPAPLARLRLDQQAPEAIDAEPVRRSLGRSSIPVANPSARAAVDLASRRLADSAGQGVPHRWAEAIASAAMPEHERVADELDQAIVGTPLRGRRPAWWSVLGVLQILLAIATVVGLAWTLVEVFFGAQDLVELPMPQVGPFGLPLVLLVGGLLAGWLTAGLARWFAAIGSRRRARAAGRRLDAAIAEVADRVVIEPVGAVLGRHARTRSSLAAAAGQRSR